MKKIASLLFTLSLAVPFVSADETALAQKIQTLIDDKGLPGMVVKIKHGKNTIFHQALGYADIENKIPMRKEQKFRIFSMTKPVTALALLKSVHDNGFALTDTVQDLYPGFDLSTPIPLTSLLTHTSGFAYGGDWSSFTGWLYWLFAPLERAESLPQMMSKLDGIPLLSEPGETFRYSMSSDVQGAIIQHVNQQDLARYMSEKLFQPLAMPDTHFVTKYTDNSELAPFYRYDADKKQFTLVDDASEWDKKVISGGGGLASTAQDYMRFLDVLRFPQAYQELVPADLTSAITRNQLPQGISTIPAQIYPNTGYGFGVGVKLENEQYLHQGSYFWAGLGGTIFVVDPQQDLAIVVMSQMLGARRSVEDNMIPIIYQWFREYYAQ